MKIILWGMLALATAFAPPPARAQAFPSRPVTIIVPYPPGGLIDLVARVIQPPLQAELGQSVVVENRSGAGGNVGAEVVAHSEPDGYTLLLANPSLAISPTLYRKLNYRPIEDFAYVGRYGSVPNVLVVNPSMPVKTARELIEYAKKNPGKLNYGSPGYGTSPQLSSELFKAMSGTFIVHIPFRVTSASTYWLRKLPDHATVTDASLVVAPHTPSTVPARFLHEIA
jgi:tripartite-type tricarboxylate transporter receptor subunit TctC